MKNSSVCNITLLSFEYKSNMSAMDTFELLNSVSHIDQLLINDLNGFVNHELNIFKISIQ